MNTLTLVESLLRDARHALRTIRLNFGFSSAAILSLGLGIGANVAIFSGAETHVAERFALNHA